MNRSLVASFATPRWASACSCSSLPASGGCWSPSVSEVVVYSEVGHAVRPADLRPSFGKRPGSRCSRSTIPDRPRRTGLAQTILAEGQRPRCDVFWNDEILNTLRLEKKGLLAAYEPAVADNYPPMYRSPQGLWHGFAAPCPRPDREHQPDPGRSSGPARSWTWPDPTWRGRCGMAKPTFGTTATHAACLFAAWGPTRAKKFFHDLKQTR